MLSTGPLVVIALTVAIGVATKKMAPFSAVILGTVISMAAFAILAVQSSVIAVYSTLVIVALGEIIQAPRYYDYISRLAPPGHQGTYMVFAFLPIGIGSLLGGWFAGPVIHQS